MVTAIGSGATSNSAEIAALEQQLAQYQKQLATDASGGTTATSAVSTELVSSQITLVETEIAQLSQASGTTASTQSSQPSSAAASTSSSSTLGTNINVVA